jgi:hypothetical protein
MAVLYHKKSLFLIALPMGLIDFLVPFAQPMSIVLFELVIFTLAVLSAFVAWVATRNLKPYPLPQEVAPLNDTEKTV